MLSKNNKKIYIGRGEGYSMTPLINKGDKLYVELINPHSIKMNDILVFLDKNKNLISHRVLAKKKNVFLTKGDNVLTFDNPVPYKSVMGKIIKIEGKYGVLNLASFQFKLINLYLLFFSIIILILPFPMKRLSFIFLRGRRTLIKLVTNNLLTNI